VTEPAKVPDFSNKSFIGLWTVVKDLVSERNLRNLGVMKLSMRLDYMQP